MTEYYPWPGDFKRGNTESPVAVDTLSSVMSFPENKVALWGQVKTENLGIERVIANVISNPNIRFLIVCGAEVRGHRSGNTILSLHKNGIDDNNRVIEAKGAVPYIENISGEAVERFREQVEVIDLVDESDMDRIMQEVDRCWEKNPGSFGEPYIALEIVEEKTAGKSLDGKVALHNTLIIDPYGEVDSIDIPEE